MTVIIRKLPAPAVFCLVVLVSCWWGILANIAAIANPSRGVTSVTELSDRNILLFSIIELLGLAAMFWIGRIRGWSFAAWGFKPSWKATGAGVLLALALLALSCVFALVYAIHPKATPSHPLTSHLSLPFLVLTVIVNPIFEETLEVGFFVQSLQRFGMWVAVLASAMFRASLHTYLGLHAVVANLLAGLIFGFAYWKWRRLWPLFIAHAIADLIMLLLYHT